MITTANIRSMMIPLLGHWIAQISGGHPPTHIYYFRDGVSEGQYSHVLEQEVLDMKRAISEFLTSKNPALKDHKVCNLLTKDFQY
jgi:eukaryotic translation initiation factor 2C